MESSLPCPCCSQTLSVIEVTRKNFKKVNKWKRKDELSLVKPSTLLVNPDVDDSEEDEEQGREDGEVDEEEEEEEDEMGEEGGGLGRSDCEGEEAEDDDEIEDLIAPPPNCIY